MLDDLIRFGGGFDWISPLRQILFTETSLIVPEQYAAWVQVAAKVQGIKLRAPYTVDGQFVAGCSKSEARQIYRFLGWQA